MLADRIEGLLATLSLWSPGILLLVAMMAFTLSSENRKQPNTFLCFGCGLIIGCLGAFGFESIEPGGWGFQLLALPFLWCKWGVVGFCGSWFLMAFTRGNGRSFVAFQWFFGLLSMVLLALTVAEHTYVRAVHRADQEFWRKTFFHRIANLPLDEYREHLSREGRESVALQLQYDKQTAPELLPILAKILPGGVGEIADQTTITRPLIERALEDAAMARTQYVMGSFAAHGGLTRLARNPGVPQDVLGKLAADPNPDVRASLALNKGASPSVLELLVNDDARNFTDLSVGILARTTLAENLQTSAARLMELGRDSVAKVRGGVARNPHTPLDLLTELARDPDAQVARNSLRTIGRSPNTPLAKLEELAENSDRNVQAAVASNPKAPVPLVIKLLHRDDYETEMAAIRNLASGDASAREALRTEIRKSAGFEWRGLSTEHRLPKWVYFELTSADHYEVRQNAFERLSNADGITEEELRDLLAKADMHTLEHLAGSSRCSPFLLRILAEGPLSELQTKARKTLDYVNEHGVYDR